MQELSYKQMLDMVFYRPLKNEYPEEIFPKAKCEAFSLGSGDTFHSVESIALMIKKYHHQAKKIAQKLRKENTEATVEAVQSFCYHYFQYNADEHTNLLYSPACAWRMRHRGIDCKSYTIMAGAILYELGITFNIRQVKQKKHAPEQFTHVFLVIPKDQKTYSKKELLAIDGTVKQADLAKMDILEHADYLITMEHWGLNGLRPPQQYTLLRGGTESVEELKAKKRTLEEKLSKLKYALSVGGDIASSVMGIYNIFKGNTPAAQKAALEREIALAEQENKRLEIELAHQYKMSQNWKPDPYSDTKEEKKDNTLLYVGIGVGALCLLGGIVYVATSKK